MQIETNYKALYQVNPMLDDEFFFKKNQSLEKKILKIFEHQSEKELGISLFIATVKSQGLSIYVN
jgi:hypothetical protein